MSAAQLFGEAGKAAGLEVWRIEKLKPVKQKPETHGTFFAGDSYIVLFTKVTKDNQYEWHIHFWLGNDSSKDEQGAAAILTIDLDDLLGGSPVQHREVQGHESSMFVSYFKKGLQIASGGVDSAFNHVVPDKYEPRLFQLKGKRDVRVNQVKLERASLNDGDVFILDAGLNLYQWNGANANKYEKAKGLELISQIKNTERGGRPTIHVLDQGINDSKVSDGEAEPFWKLLGGFGPVQAASAAGDDDAAPKSGPPTLWKISDSTGKLVVEKVVEGKMERSHLDTKDVFMVDSTSELFVWVGKLSTKNEKKRATEYAVEYLKKNNRPDWCPITRVNEGCETPVFKSFFNLWDPPRKLDAEKKAPVLQKKSDLSALYVKGQAEEEKVLDDGKGKTTIWRVENLKLETVPQNTYGQFYAGDSYVVLYEYEQKGKPFQMLYFWQGRDSSGDEKSASAMLTVQMDDELTSQGKDPTQVRVVMGKEPNHFLSIFKGKFIVHAGGHASGWKNRNDKDSYDTDGVGLYHVKGTSASNVRAIQVAEKALSLNSLDVFVLVTPKTIYTWYGKGATADERKYADEITSLMQVGRKVEKIEEGHEPQHFWDFIGGKTDYPHTKLAEQGGKEPRLFHGHNKVGHFTLEEIFNFSQEDLDSEDVFLLDAYNEVWVWVGAESNSTERTEVFQAALDYVKKVQDGRDPDTPVLKVDAGKEPPLFTQYFLGWEDVAHDVNQEDPYLAKLRMLKGDEAVQRITAVSQISEYLDPATHKFPLAELQKGLKKVDPKRKHEYLSDEEFKKVFKVTLAEFNKFQDWKKKNLRQAANLF